MQNMENILSNLSDDIVDIALQYTNISNEVKDFISNKNILIKDIDKISDLITKNLCDQKENDILTDLLKILKIIIDTLNLKLKDENITERITVRNESNECATINKKCKYHNRGYCKHGAKCSYRHYQSICDEFLQNGNCAKPKLCKFRHPK